jgi:hypothetical protein
LRFIEASRFQATRTTTGERGVDQPTQRQGDQPDDADHQRKERCQQGAGDGEHGEHGRE